MKDTLDYGMTLGIAQDSAHHNPAIWGSWPAGEGPEERQEGSPKALPSPRRRIEPVPPRQRQGVMADAVTFEWLCAELEQASSLDRLETRGTVRLALKQAGLQAASVTADQMQVVVAKVLPSELESRGIEDAPAICQALQSGLRRLAADPATSAGMPERPDDVFRRLGGGF